MRRLVFSHLFPDLLPVAGQLNLRAKIAFDIIAMRVHRMHIIQQNEKNVSKSSVT